MNEVSSFLVIFIGICACPLIRFAGIFTSREEFCGFEKIIDLVMVRLLVSCIHFLVLQHQLLFEFCKAHTVNLVVLLRNKLCFPLVMMFFVDLKESYVFGNMFRILITTFSRTMLAVSAVHPVWFLRNYQPYECFHPSCKFQSVKNFNTTIESVS